MQHCFFDFTLHCNANVLYYVSSEKVAVGIMYVCERVGQLFLYILFSGPATMPWMYEKSLALYFYILTFSPLMDQKALLI